MTEQDIYQLATAWVECCVLPHDSARRHEVGWATGSVIDLSEDHPEELWRFILTVHKLDQSVTIQQRLSAGPIEDLLGIYGEKFIGLVETEAQRDPSFARVLGGVWKNSMSDEVWQRVQAVWDRRGWDGIPE